MFPISLDNGYSTVFSEGNSIIESDTWDQPMRPLNTSMIVLVHDKLRCQSMRPFVGVGGGWGVVIIN